MPRMAKEKDKEKKMISVILKIEKQRIPIADFLSGNHQPCNKYIKQVK